MNIKNIRLINFRNYFSLNVKLNEKINILIGKNAQGKTNFLESIYLCATGKSFRTNSDKDMINFDKSATYVGADVIIDNFSRFIEVKLERSNPKIIRINKNILQSSKELDSGLNVVVFSPDDLNLIKEGPSVRRDFLNREISQINPLYNYNLKKYDRILYQRNIILKSNKSVGEKKALIEVFDLQLIKYGVFIVKERRQFIEKLSVIANVVHKDVTELKESLSLIYNSNIELDDNLNYMEKKFLESLRENIDSDIFNRTTALGPHRDDIRIMVNDKDLRTYGSQGQQRTAVLSIKLSEVELIYKENGDHPILLLDDVFSELDKSRRKYLIKSLKNIQTIITVTDAIDLKEIADVDKTIFRVDNGLFEKEGI